MRKLVRSAFVLALTATFLIFANSELLAQKDKNDGVRYYTDYNIGDIVEVIDKNANYHLRIYVFADFSICKIYKLNIARLTKRLKSDNINFIVFLNSVNQKNANKIREKYDWNCKIIGDEYNIYKAYYKIKSQATMIILNNEGKILEAGKIGGIGTKRIKELIEENKVDIKKPKNYKSHLKEIKRIDIKYKDGTNLLSGWYRSVLYDDESNRFLVRANRQCDIYVADSSGLIIDTINKSKYSNYNCFMPSPFSWAWDDSVLFLYHMNYRAKRFYQFYNLKSKKLSESKTFKIKKRGTRNRHSLHGKFWTNNNVFLLFYNNRPENKNESENFILDSTDRTIYAYDISGNEIAAFDSPDSPYLKYKISDWFVENVAQDERNNLLSIQNYSNKLKFWNRSFELRKVQEINLGEPFRKINFDFNDSLSKEDVNNIWNNISFTYSLLYDKKNQHSLIAYCNDSIPEGVFDMSSDKIKKRMYLVISNADGEKLTSEPILMPGHSVPFYFDDSLIYATELTSDKKFQIVLYRF